MLILSIETSADETAAAVTSERRVLSNVIYSQILLHKKWGGIYPSLAKRAHEERIDSVVVEALRKFSSQNVILGKRRKALTPESLLDSGRASLARMTETMEKIDYIAVTQGPGLAVALEVGIRKAKELAQEYHKKLIAVNHLEGHIYSSFVQNSQGIPKRDFRFPYLALIVSGGHTEIVLFKGHIDYQVLGETRDDAAGEALDKSAKALGLGYPGGPVMERLSREVENQDFFKFPRPMIRSKNLDFSFSGLKTSFYYFLRSQTSKNSNFGETNLKQLVSSFQSAVFDTVISKMDSAIIVTGINRLVVGGGVIANLYLRKLLRDLVKKHNGEIYFPTYKYLTGDNAAMIGVAAYFKAINGLFVKNLDLDRIPRLNFPGDEITV